MGAKPDRWRRHRAIPARLVRRGGLFLVIVALALAACEEVSGFIPGDGSDAGRPPEEVTPAPDATPILPASNGTGNQNIPPASAVPDHELARTVVQIRAIDESRDETVRVGSGVIVDAEQRLILTSYPLVQPTRSDGTRAYSTIAIALAPQTGEAPQLAFEAEIAAADARMQLAVLRVTSGLDESAIADEEFPGVAAFLGEVSAISAGSTIRMFGHPASHGEADAQPVSMTNAGVTGFRAAPDYTGRAWIKTDARLPHGLAGGPVFDQLGVLLGVLVQEDYLPQGDVSHARPIDPALELIEQARAEGSDQIYEAPLMMTGHIPGSSQPRPQDGLWASRPKFAMNATETAAGRDLFDYTYSAPSGTDTIYYEFAIAGVENGEEIEERWFLDGVQQDSLSSSYVWDRGRFGFITDRVFTPSNSGLPDGRWRLEVWIADELRATATVLIGVPGGEPSISESEGGTVAARDATALVAPSSDADQLLAFFDFSGFDSVAEIEWIVFHDNQPVYQSPSLPWSYGDAGRTWVGYRPSGGISAGSWEFEIYADGELVDTIAITVS